MDHKGALPINQVILNRSLGMWWQGNQLGINNYYLRPGLLVLILIYVKF